jgi:hypothetical protein
MAESKLTDQTTLTTPADGDWAYLVDISDTSGGALGTSKKITVANLMTKAPVISVNGEVGAVSLDSTEIKRVGTTGDSIDQDLTAAENNINAIKAVLKYPVATVTGLQVDTSNKLEIDSTNQKAIFTVNGLTAATIGPSQSLFPALKVGPTSNDYTLPVARGVTGNVAVYDDATHTSEWRSLATGNLSGTSDGITQGTTNLFLTSAERTKLTSVTSGAAVASVSGTAPIVSSGGTTPAISITAATTLAAGSMSASDKSKLDGITAGAAVASVTGTAPIVSSGGTTPAISITAATTSAAGSMSAADKSKLDGIAAGAEVNVNADWNAVSGDAQILNKPTIVSSVTGTAPIVSSGGTTPAISITAATTSAAGSMSSADKSKLDGIAAGAEVNVNADWNAVSGDAQILNKPTIPSITQVTGKTVATGAWSLVSGVYEASISDAAITSTSIVNIIPNNASAATIRTAQMLPQTDSSSGAVKIYSTNAPGATITVTLNIYKQ